MYKSKRKSKAISQQEMPRRNTGESTNTTSYQQGTCRCCLSQGSFESMDLRNITVGTSQSYAEILQTIFGLDLVLANPPRLICDLCAIQLLQALKFYNQVEAAEIKFTSAKGLKRETANKKFDIEKPVKSKCETIPVQTTSELKSKKECLNTDLQCSYMSVIDVLELGSGEICEYGQEPCDSTECTELKVIPTIEAVENANTGADLNDAEYQQFMMCDICKETHAPDEYLQCRICRHAFKSEQEKSEHVYCDLHQCSFCDHMFESREQKNDHRNYCNYVLCKLNRHLLIPNEANTVKKNLYRCEICKSSHKIEELKVKHQGVDSLTCTHCKRVFLSTKDRDDHVERHKIQCSVCDQIFPTAYLKKRHYRSKHGKKCTVCHTMVLPHLKKKHDIECHEAKPHKCNICNKTFTLPSDVRKHQRNVHNENFTVASCPHCLYEAFNEKSLKRHMTRQHSTNKNHECKYCNKKFAWKTTLVYHERIHTGDKRAVCKICGDAFVQRASLKYHTEKYHPGALY